MFQKHISKVTQSKFNKCIWFLNQKQLVRNTTLGFWLLYRNFYYNIFHLKCFMQRNTCEQASKEKKMLLFHTKA